MDPAHLHAHANLPFPKSTSLRSQHEALTRWSRFRKAFIVANGTRCKPGGCAKDIAQKLVSQYRVKIVNNQVHTVKHADGRAAGSELGDHRAELLRAARRRHHADERVGSVRVLRSGADAAHKFVVDCTFVDVHLQVVCMCMCWLMCMCMCWLMRTAGNVRQVGDARQTPRRHCHCAHKCMRAVAALCGGADAADEVVVNCPAIMSTGKQRAGVEMHTKAGTDYPAITHASLVTHATVRKRTLARCVASATHHQHRATNAQNRTEQKQHIALRKSTWPSSSRTLSGAATRAKIRLLTKAATAGGSGTVPLRAKALLL